MLYRDQTLGRAALGRRIAAQLAAVFSGRRHQELDVLAMNRHLRRDLGLDEHFRRFTDGDIFRK